MQTSDVVCRSRTGWSPTCDNRRRRHKLFFLSTGFAVVNCVCQSKSSPKDTHAENRRLIRCVLDGGRWQLILSVVCWPFVGKMGSRCAIFRGTTCYIQARVWRAAINFFIPESGGWSGVCVRGWKHKQLNGWKIEKPKRRTKWQIVIKIQYFSTWDRRKKKDMSVKV